MIWTGKSLAAGEKMQGYFAEWKRQAGRQAEEGQITLGPFYNRPLGRQTTTMNEDRYKTATVMPEPGER
jgi:hypothetical protein